MRLQTQTSYYAIMVAVDVCIYPIQPLEDRLNRTLEVRRERHARVRRKDGGIAQVVAGPREQVGDVGRCWKTGGFGVVGRVVPEVFELVSRFHLWAGLRGAELGDGAVEKVDLVVEVDDCSLVSLWPVLSAHTQM